ncbi:MAG: nodulation protein NfeD, partial [Thermoleophilia bacterium]|nr:nodulation protein NfeD [Thermoleophilia bacterium]
MRAALTVLAAIAAILAGAAAAGGQDQAPPVWVISLEGTIDPVNATFVERRLDDAEAGGAEVAVLRVDTPGGFDASMREIVGAMRGADLDVAVWVGPSGARAGSAGAYIAAASDHLGMAPGTNIGSATPVGGGGGQDLDAKIRGDAAAFIAALAQESGRDAAAYRAMVDDAANYTASQAVDRGVAETVQPTLEGFVAWLDGREGRGGAPLATAGAPLQERDLPWYLRALQVLIDPNLVFILLLLGLAGLGYEIFTP